MCRLPNSSSVGPLALASLCPWQCYEYTWGGAMLETDCCQQQWHTRRRDGMMAR